jgi:hypothetical protein
MTTHFFGKNAASFRPAAILDSAPLSLSMNCAICTRRFSRKLFENAIELRKRLEPDRECNLPDTQIRIPQAITRFFEANTRHVLDKICSSYLLEHLAKMIRANFDCFRDFFEPKVLGRVFFDETPRFRDSTSAAAMLCRCRNYYWSRDVLHLLTIPQLILLAW